MDQHSEKFKVHHEFLLLTTVKNLKEKSDQGEEKLKEKDMEIIKLKELNTEKDETLNTLKNDFDNLKNQLEQLTNKIKRNEEETNKCFKKINKNQTEQSIDIDQFKENINNLQTFAERISKLHCILSDKRLQTNYQYTSTLLQENYDQDEVVRNWNGMIRKVNEDENGCEYLETLTASINEYKKTIYSSTYEERLSNFCCLTPEGIYCAPFIKIGCHEHTESICVTTFNNLEDFKQENNSSYGASCKIQYDPYSYSYYVGDCLHVVFWTPDVNVYLLHNSNEERKLDIPNGVVVNLDNILNLYMVQDSFVLYLMDNYG